MVNVSLARFVTCIISSLIRTKYHVELSPLDAAGYSESPIPIGASVAVVTTSFISSDKNQSILADILHCYCLPALADQLTIFARRLWPMQMYQ